MPLDPETLQKLVSEREKIEAFLTPPEKTPEQLAAEIVIQNWKKKATARLTEIDNLLIPHFFPKAKDEGVQRTETDDFFAAIKPALKRTFDLAAIKPVTAKLKAAGVPEDFVIKYTPGLILDNYRDLTEAQKRIFDQCLVITPAPTTLEIVRKTT